MKRPEFRFFPPKFFSGFGLIELLVSLAIVSILAMGAYKLFGTVTYKGIEATKDLKDAVQGKKIAYRMAIEVSNIPIIPSYDEETPGTVLTNLDFFDGITKIASSIVPLPGKTKSNVESLTFLSPLQPSDTSLISGKNSDAIRFVFLDIDSESFILLEKPDGFAQPDDLDDLSDGQYTVSDTSPILLYSSAGSKIKIGDFLLLSDSSKSDLVRVTNKETVDADSTTPILGGLEKQYTKLYRDPSVSIWNTSFEHTYGATTPTDSLAYVQKVAVRTYAYDDTNKTLVMDTHVQDDHFNNGVFGAPGLTFNWSVIATEVEQFQIWYNSSIDPKDTRTPKADQTEISNSQNQIGFPSLNRIMVRYKDENGSSRWELNPENLNYEKKNSDGGDLSQSPTEIYPIGVTPTVEGTEEPTVTVTPTITPPPTPPPAPNSKKRGSS